MQKHALFIVALENFRDEEFFVPQKILAEAGIETTVASQKAGKCVGKLGGSVEAVIGLNQINVEDFDAVIFVGGSGSQIFNQNIAAHLIARKAAENNKVLAAICAAPTILAKAGVLDGKQAAVFPDPHYQTILADGGATLTCLGVETDGNIITANGPAVAEEFGKKIVAAIEA